MIGEQDSHIHSGSCKALQGLEATLLSPRRCVGCVYVCVFGLVGLGVELPRALIADNGNQSEVA